jgi:GrpB-like predicted nucleotidyltransferase (UPF0157 family)
VASLILDEDESLIVEHVGSTAVGGCPGKGYIDVLVLVSHENQFAATSEAVRRIGFAEHDFGQGCPGARGVVEFGGTPFRVHIQILLQDSTKAREIIAFRELLKNDPDVLATYGARKQQLIAAGIDRNPEYTNGKSDLIRDALQRRRSG